MRSWSLAACVIERKREGEGQRDSGTKVLLLFSFLAASSGQSDSVGSHLPPPLHCLALSLSSVSLSGVLATTMIQWDGMGRRVRQKEDKEGLKERRKKGRQTRGHPSFSLCLADSLAVSRSLATHSLRRSRVRGTHSLAARQWRQFSLSHAVS